MYRSPAFHRHDAQGQRLTPPREYSRLGSEKRVPLPSPRQWNWLLA
jgi:hypothetical protein